MKAAPNLKDVTKECEVETKLSEKIKKEREYLILKWVTGSLYNTLLNKVNTMYNITLVSM